MNSAHVPSISDSTHPHFLKNNGVIFKVPVRVFFFLSYTIFKLAFLLFFGTPGMSEEMRCAPPPLHLPDKCMASAAPSIINWVPVYLLALNTFCTKPKKFQTKVFSFIFTQVQNDIHSIFYLAKSQKMHLNFERVHIDR